MNIRTKLTKTASLLWAALGLAALLVLAIAPGTVVARAGAVAMINSSPVGVLSTGLTHNCALKPDGSVYCWGSDLDGESTAQSGPFIQVGAGGSHTCALKPDGSVDCWGWDGYGQATDQPGPFTQISAGENHNCGLKQDGSVDCWGVNGAEQAADQPGPFIQLSAATYHTCGLRPDGSIDCWGDNYYGQSAHQSGPFTQVSAGHAHTCGLRPDGSVDCWGNNMTGESNDQPGPFTQISAGYAHTCGLKPDGAIDCWGGEGFGPAEDQLGPFTQVSAATFHTCGLKQDGSVDCWGDTQGWGELADPLGPFGAYVPPYAFTGFYSPVDSLPTLNTVKAGQSIPVRFSLGGDRGLEIFTAGYPKAQQIACDSGAPGDAIEETMSSASSGLQYDPATDTYTYAWKTQKSWARTCRQLVVRLTDGTEHIASFQFK